jgi:hypothetical protein
MLELREFFCDRQQPAREPVCDDPHFDIHGRVNSLIADTLHAKKPPKSVSPLFPLTAPVEYSFFRQIWRSVLGFLHFLGWQG